MAYPLIILGAGASIGFKKENTGDAPPDTNNLFNHNYSASIYNLYKEVASLAVGVDYKVNAGYSFEAYLTEIFEREVKFNKHRYKHLVALRFYLQHLFKLISSNYYNEKNNYKYIIDQIDSAGGKAIFVNFNYDLLLERNFPHIYESENVNSYISGDMKIIKIHGACNWTKITHGEEGSENFPNAYDVFMTIAENLFTEFEGQNNSEILIKNTAHNWDFTERAIGKVSYHIPALAMPLTNKRFICPDTHIEELKNKIKNNIDRILVIGWRANDPFLINLLKEYLPKRRIATLIVSKNNPGEIAQKLRRIIPFLQIEIPQLSGFTEFISTGECDKFFQMPSQEYNL